MLEMYVSISVTVKSVGGISLCDGGKLEESELVLVRDLLSNRSALVIRSTLQWISKQWFITQQITARAD